MHPCFRSSNILSPSSTLYLQVSWWEREYSLREFTWRGTKSHNVPPSGHLDGIMKIRESIAGVKCVPCNPVRAPVRQLTRFAYLARRAVLQSIKPLILIHQFASLITESVSKGKLQWWEFPKLSNLSVSPRNGNGFPEGQRKLWPGWDSNPSNTGVLLAS